MMSFSNYKINDIIWAKLRGYSVWPAKVTNPSDVPEQKHEVNKYFVTFLGTNNYAYLHPDKMWPYTEYKEQFIKSMHHSRKSAKLYLEAVKQADELVAAQNLVDDREVYVFNNQWTSTLLHNIFQLQQQGILCDVVMFDSHGNQILLHSIVLACCSTWWQSVFKETARTLEGKARHSWKTSYLDPDTWRVIVHLIYSGDAVIESEQHLDEVLRQLHGMKLNMLLDHLISIAEHWDKGRSWQELLHAQLRHYQLTEKLCDLHIQVNTGQRTVQPNILAHTLLLVASSAKLRQDVQFGCDGIFTLHVGGVVPNIWNKLLQFVYCGRVAVSKVELIVLKMLANSLQMCVFKDALISAELANDIAKVDVPSGVLVGKDLNVADKNILVARNPSQEGTACVAAAENQSQNATQQAKQIPTSEKKVIKKRVYRRKKNKDVMLYSDTDKTLITGNDGVQPANACMEQISEYTSQQETKTNQL